MTGTINQIRAVIAAIEEGKSDGEINRLCALAFGWVYGIRREFPPCLGSQCIDFDEWTRGSDGEIRGDAPNYCASLDAIIAEMPEGWDCIGTIETKRYAPGKYIHGCDIYDLADLTIIASADNCANRYRALLLALLRAMEAKADVA